MTAGPLRLGYGTNGFSDHRLGDALAVIAELGYDGVALTLDHPHLDPFARGVAARTTRVAHRLDELGLAVVVETGARYLLDPRRKHQPTLVSASGRERRVELLCRAVDIAADLGAEAMSFWSGAPPADAPPEESWDRLTAGCAAVVGAADHRGVDLAFEPEPGMFVDRLDGALELRSRLGDPSRFRLTLDVGHCRCNESDSVANCVRRALPQLASVQIEDMRRDVHEHLEFGAGEIDFPPVLAALVEGGYAGLVSVELPRHSHAAPVVAARSLEFLRAALGAATVAS